MSVLHPYLLRDDVELSVSWDFIAREKHEKVYQNMIDLKKPFHILMLASKALIDLPDNRFLEMISLLNQIPNINSLEIKPYSKNQHNFQDVDFAEHERWIKKWYAVHGSLKFEFINDLKIKNSLEGKYSNWSDNHLYINPDARYAVLEFDSSGREYFKSLNGISEYWQWCESEKDRVGRNSFCSGCEYFGHCLSEHLQDVQSLNRSCNGFKGLLDWYKYERIQGQAASI